jgi:hypothetical protein
MTQIQGDKGWLDLCSFLYIRLICFTWVGERI